MKLFAVYLGGRAPKCNTELHDVVFVVGESIEGTYERLLELWFGSAEGLHIDSWMELSVVDKHRVRLNTEPATMDKKLFFVNLVRTPMESLPSCMPMRWWSARANKR